MFSVDHGGKLFERIEANALPVMKNAIETTIRSNHYCKRVFAHATENIGAGSFPQRTGWVLLLLFLPTKKSKNDRRLSIAARIVKTKDLIII